MNASELSTPSPTELILRRTFAAPCERVFRAWLSPEIMRIFLANDAHAIREVVVDPRVGGAYRLTWDGADGPMAVGGIYREIVEPRRIVCTWVWEEDDGTPVHSTLLTLEFHPHGERTELVLTHASLRNEESRDRHAEGWSGIFENFAHLIEAAPAASAPA